VVPSPTPPLAVPGTGNGWRPTGSLVESAFNFLTFGMGGSMYRDGKGCYDGDKGSCGWFWVDLVLLGLVVVGPLAEGATAARGAVAVEAVGEGATASGLSISEKIARQMGPRGWSESLEKEVLEEPVTTHSVWDFTSGSRQAATAYVRSDGAYVVINDETRAVVQISDINKVGWKPVWEDPRFLR
jgi:hypothetical protein